MRQVQTEPTEVTDDPERGEGKTRQDRADQREIRPEELGHLRPHRSARKHACRADEHGAAHETDDEPGDGFHTEIVDERSARAMTELS